MYVLTVIIWEAYKFKGLIWSEFWLLYFSNCPQIPHIFSHHSRSLETPVAEKFTGITDTHRHALRLHIIFRLVGSIRPSSTVHIGRNHWKPDLEYKESSDALPNCFLMNLKLFCQWHFPMNSQTDRTLFTVTSLFSLITEDSHQWMSKLDMVFSCHRSVCSSLSSWITIKENWCFAAIYLMHAACKVSGLVISFQAQQKIHWNWLMFCIVVLLSIMFVI
jgi:hypothetical protein